MVLWNSPTEGCHVNFSVNIELQKYGILTNSNQTWDGEVVTVFYNGQLGLYPFYRNEDENMKYNDGLPQLVNMTEHLQKAAQDIAEKIPEPNYSGLAVIDWERWRPLWDTNFGKKYLYKTQSILLVKKGGKLKNESEIKIEAKRRFESAAKRLMIKTIELGKRLRPRALWGFYGFPDCHGNCTEQSENWNDELGWLYKSSTALFPSIYLMDDISDNNKYVAERLKEAFRVSRITEGPVYGYDLPVFPYLRPLYHFGAREFKMLSEDDLENAIGQAVDFGSAGLILWGNHHDERTSREICLKYNNYVNGKLGPYISMLTEELETCSKLKCFSNGRCVERALAGDEPDEERKCSSVVKYGTVFKMNNTASEIHKGPRKTLFFNSNTKEMKNQKKVVKNFPTKENKTGFTKTAGLNEILTSIHNTTTAKSAKEATMKIDRPNKKLIELFASNPNETKETSSPPYWNKNSILGLKKNHKVDYLSIESEDVTGNISERQGMLNEKRGNGSQGIQNEIEAKRSETDVNTTSSHKQHTPKQKQVPKRGYSARVGEETAVRVPGVYIILITVTLGGALLMTIIYVAIYYTVNVRGRSRDSSYDYEYGPGDENPFSVDPHSPWWNDDVDPAEKLLKSEREKK